MIISGDQAQHNRPTCLIIGVGHTVARRLIRILHYPQERATADYYNEPDAAYDCQFHAAFLAKYCRMDGKPEPATPGTKQRQDLKVASDGCDTHRRQI